jgi:hypothetical protein
MRSRRTACTVEWSPDPDDTHAHCLVRSARGGILGDVTDVAQAARTTASLPVVAPVKNPALAAQRLPHIVPPAPETRLAAQSGVYATVSCEPEELAAFADAARKQGLSLSEWIRATALDAVTRPASRKVG